MARVRQIPTCSRASSLASPVNPPMPSRPDESSHHIEVKRLDHVARVADDWWARQVWWLRERFQAVTGIGLAQASSADAGVRRYVSSERNGVSRLGYMAAGDPAGRKLLFVHGTPGEAADWSRFLRQVPEGQYRIAVDRPGFGESNPGAPVVALKDQARALANLLAPDARPAIVIGSSYGGPVALSLATHYPQHVAGVVLVGAAADPEREEIHPLQRVAATRAVQRLLPAPLRHSNAELFALRSELDSLGQHLHKIRAPVTILQGMRDTLVPPENAHYLYDRLIGAIRKRLVFIEDMGHFLHLLQSDLVEDTLHHMLEDTANA